MKLFTTLTNIVSTFCILAITALILMIIWDVIDRPEQVWRVLVSLGIIYLATLLLCGRSESHN